MVVNHALFEKNSTSLGGSDLKQEKHIWKSLLKVIFVGFVYQETIGILARDNFERQNCMVSICLKTSENILLSSSQRNETRILAAISGIFKHRSFFILFLTKNRSLWTPATRRQPQWRKKWLLGGNNTALLGSETYEWLVFTEFLFYFIHELCWIEIWVCWNLRILKLQKLGSRTHTHTVWAAVGNTFHIGPTCGRRCLQRKINGFKIPKIESGFKAIANSTTWLTFFKKSSFFFVVHLHCDILWYHLS